MATDAPPDPPHLPDADVVTEASRLQALAHPLRLRMLGLLRLEGPSTASRLAQRCGESSGLTSYHLRQLAGAGFVVDADAADLVGREVRGRDRWWKAASRFTVTHRPALGGDAEAAASGDYYRAVVDLYAERARAWLLVEHTWPEQWQASSSLGDRMLSLTPEEVTALRADLDGVLARYRQHDPALPPGTGSVPADAVGVSLQLQLFPDPEQTPPGPAEPAPHDAGPAGPGPAS
ncbi:winged helix-turn-helix domain-containing protein [uncultured Pseudokineococcus sp.]|uniref:winged helix-turn-helix domain-containing protein n=1 Tax=uncultured Pseudokineococcus sp. TaxID=1642928 RepID=UPI00261164E8|nr:winged helix-turn-helix domain-containing protein [uncultured Pseudokineococcus sp.]